MRGVHVGDLALHQLKGADRLAELFSLVHVGQHHVHAGLHDADRARRQHRPLIVEARHQHVDAAADLAEHVLLRYLAILEQQFAGVGAAHAELVEFLRGGKSLHALFDDEGGHAARAGVEVGLGVDHQRVGDGTVGDPHLVAVERQNGRPSCRRGSSSRPRRCRRRPPTSPASRHVRRRSALAGTCASDFHYRCGGSG